jgi:hypothetical protein
VILFKLYFLKFVCNVGTYLVQYGPFQTIFIFSTLFVMLVHFLYRVILFKLFNFLKFVCNVGTFLVQDDPFQTVFIFSNLFVMLVHFLYRVILFKLFNFLKFVCNFGTFLVQDDLFKLYGNRKHILYVTKHTILLSTNLVYIKITYPLFLISFI